MTLTWTTATKILLLPSPNHSWLCLVPTPNCRCCHLLQHSGPACRQVLVCSTFNFCWAIKLPAPVIIFKPHLPHRGVVMTEGNMYTTFSSLKEGLYKNMKNKYPYSNKLNGGWNHSYYLSGCCSFFFFFCHTSEQVKWMYDASLSPLPHLPELGPFLILRFRAVFCSCMFSQGFELFSSPHALCNKEQIDHQYAHYSWDILCEECAGNGSALIVQIGPDMEITE